MTVSKGRQQRPINIILFKWPSPSEVRKLQHSPKVKFVSCLCFKCSWFRDVLQEIPCAFHWWDAASPVLGPAIIGRGCFPEKAKKNTAMYSSLIIDSYYFKTLQRMIGSWTIQWFNVTSLLFNSIRRGQVSVIYFKITVCTVQLQTNNIQGHFKDQSQFSRTKINQ